MDNFNDIIKEHSDNLDVNNPFGGFTSREEFLAFQRERQTKVNVIEEQKTYIWTRVYLNESDDTLKAGDKVYIKYNESGETLETVFAAYNKKNVVKDKDGVQNYEPEDDKKVLCLAVDIEYVNRPVNDIPFIKTLFKQGRFYEFQLMKLNELTIYSDNKEFEFHSIDF